MTGTTGGEWEKCRFAVVTALPKEFAAMLAVLDDARPVTIPADPNDYALGKIPAIDGTGNHYVIVALQKKPANNSASAVASHLSHSFPNLEDVLMVGIAGGVPHPTDPDKHVRLGDVVVCDQNGIVQYDHLKVEHDHVLVRSAAAPPSASLLGKVRILEAARLAGTRPWEQHILRAKLEGATRPDPSTDRLFAVDESHTELPHPEDTYRRSGHPKIYYGPIGSSNVLLKDPEIRDALRDRFGVRAIEMEGSGIADGTWTVGLGYIVIRGISDYCDQHKNDTWQGYAAVAAASYARALVESFTVITDPATQRQLDEAKNKMTEAHAAIDSNDFDIAAKAAEVGADLAMAAGDSDLQRRALLQAIRAWGEHVGCGRVRDREAAAISHRARKLVDRLKALGEKTGIIALELAQLGRFDRPPSEVLQCVGQAANDHDPIIRAEALVIHLQTLWRMEDLEAAAGLAAKAKELGQLVPGDVRLVVDATWLRTLCKAGKHQDADVEAFVALIDAMANPERASYQRTAMVVGQVAAEFNMAGHLSAARALCEAAYLLVAGHSDAQMLTNIALQIAELSAELKDTNTARLYLGRAESWAAERNEDVESADTLRANVLFAKGRTLTRIADHTEPADESLYREGFEALKAARIFGQENRLRIQGNVELFLADVSWWLGRTAVNLGHLVEAGEYLKTVRSDVAMANLHFCAEVVPKAWLLEAESLALSGRVDEASRVAATLIDDGRIRDESKKRARDFARFLKHRIQPLLDWFNSPDAQSIARECATHGLRTVVADQVVPLVAWWHDWHQQESGAESELLDFWGRGGFSSVAAAIRAKAHAAIAVDARSVAEIRTWARILCPLFDTVVVKWKGKLGTGIVLVPQQVDFTGAGGHGYAVTSDRCSKTEYAVSMSWANPIPREVTSFLAGEALPLFSAGRLLVFPAPLVGCSQSAVGWTDNLLVEGLLGGIVNVGRSTPRDASERVAGPQRILDLAHVKFPFIDNIAMHDLASVLHDTERWTGPLRRHIMSVLASGDLNNERWASIVGLEQEIQDACRELTEGLTGVAREREWCVEQVDGTMAVGSRGPAQPPAREPITGFLQSVASDRRELAPWIPYWCLQDRGGYLNWTCPLDNQSTPPDHGTMVQMAAMGVEKSDELHSWLYPGTAGWFFPTAIRVST
jgi:nucleoside phosphorylase